MPKVVQSVIGSFLFYMSILGLSIKKIDAPQTLHAAVRDKEDFFTPNIDPL